MTGTPDRRADGRGALLVGVALAAAMTASPLHAFTLFGHAFFEKDKAADDISPDAQRYEVSLDVADGGDDLKSAIEAASALWSGREETPPPSSAALISRVDAEYGRITAALYQAGRYGGSVKITVDGRDPDAIAPDAKLPQPVKVAIAVEPGPLFRFGRVAIDGAPTPGPEDEGVKLALPADAGLVTGKPAKADIVLQSERLIVDAWRRRGHPLAEVVKRDTVANHADRTLDVSLTVDPGPEAGFGPIAVTGTRRMDAAYVAYMTGIRPGDPYAPKAIARAEKNLRRLGVFSSQRIEEGKKLDGDGRLPLTAQLAERPLRMFGGGVSYSTLDGAGLEGYWQHRNLFGKAESLRLSASVSGVDSLDPSNFTYSAGATFVKPGVLTPFTDFTAALSASREDLDTYTEDRVEAKAGLSHALSEALTATFGGSLVATRDRDDSGERRFLLASLPGELIWDDRDDKTDPHRGVNALGHLEPFYEIRGGHAGVIAKASAASYLSLDADGRLVLAGRIAGGSILGAPASGLPDSRLFYAGGGSSVRGYTYRGLGPTDAAGNITGGRSFLEASAEVRARISEAFGVAVFADAGNAFAQSYPDFDEGIRMAVGAGIRYYTGLGPIRLDVALPVSGKQGSDGYGLYIGLGQSF